MLSYKMYVYVIWKNIHPAVFFHIFLNSGVYQQPYHHNISDWWHLMLIIHTPWVGWQQLHTTSLKAEQKMAHYP